MLNLLFPYKISEKHFFVRYLLNLMFYILLYNVMLFHFLSVNNTSLDPMSQYGSYAAVQACKVGILKPLFESCGWHSFSTYLN